MKRINVFLGARCSRWVWFRPRTPWSRKRSVTTHSPISAAGEFTNVSLTSDGHLELAPAMTNLAGVTDPIIWAAVQDDKGNVFFGTGNQGKVYKLTPKGELSTFFEPNEVMVHALAIDGKGRLYAATSPNGRVYRLDAGGHAEVFCNPGETYIWAMTFGEDGSLFLATGDHGKVLRVPPSGSTPARAETYFETKEANITALALDKDGSLLAGTSPHGYLYRIDKNNRGFVVFNSGDKEIKQIAVATNGAIYVSTFSGNLKSEAKPPDLVPSPFQFRQQKAEIRVMTLPNPAHAPKTKLTAAATDDGGLAAAIRRRKSDRFRSVSGRRIGRRRAIFGRDLSHRHQRFLRARIGVRRARRFIP